MNEYREIIEKDNGFITRELDFIGGGSANTSGDTFGVKGGINKGYDV